MSFDQSKEPSQSEVQAAAFAVVMAPPIAVQNLYKPVSAASIDTAAANKKADGAKGKAVAHNLIKELLKQEVSLVRYLRNIAELGQEGRTQFRTALKDNIGELKALLALGGAKGPDDKESYEYKMIRQAHATATVRMSEIKVFSEACDIGFTFADGETYPCIISAARMFKQGIAAPGENGAVDGVGPTRRRGRPATPFADKFKKFLADNVTEENHAEAREFFNTWIALQNFGKEPQA